MDDGSKNVTDGDQTKEKPEEQESKEQKPKTSDSFYLERMGEVSKKTLLKAVIGASVVVVISIIWLYLAAYSNYYYSPWAAFFISIFMLPTGFLGILAKKEGRFSFWAVIAGPVIGLFFGLFTATFFLYGAFNSFIAAILAGVVGAIIPYISWDYSWDWKDNKERHLSIILMTLLWLIFALPLCFGIIPFSKHHNQNQFERDRKIVDIFLQVTDQENDVEILLPSEHLSENSYLNQVLSIEWIKHGPIMSWKRNAILCKEGDKHWYKCVFPKFPDEKSPELILRFVHTWADFETVIPFSPYSDKADASQ